MVLFSWATVSLCVPALSLNILKNQVRNGPVPAAGDASPLPGSPYPVLGGQRLQGSVFHRTAWGAGGDGGSSGERGHKIVLTA